LQLDTHSHFTRPILSFLLLAKYDPQKKLLATASPAGDTILLHEPQRIAGQWTSQFELLDTDQLTLRKSWTDNSRIPFRIVWSDKLAWISSGLFFLEGLLGHAIYI
jgi:hypothetical protein